MRCFLTNKYINLICYDGQIICPIIIDIQIIIELLLEYRPRRQCVLWCCVVLYCAKANIPGLQPRESRVAAGWSVFSVLSPLRSAVTSPNMVTLSHCHSPESGLTFYPRATIVFSWTDGQVFKAGFLYFAN